MTAENITDSVLVIRAHKGDTAAFKQLVERHQRKAYAVAVGILCDREDARDVCQEAFVRAYRSLSSFNGEAQFFTWLYRIVRNLCIDHLRKKRGERVDFDDARAQDVQEADTVISPRRLAFDPADALSNKELRGRLQNALRELSATHRTVIVMRELEGLSYQEMATQMGCSIGTIMSRLFHARRKLQTLMLGDRAT